MNTPVIEAVGVVKRFGTQNAVDGVDLRVEKGELFGLIGHNGAGKSTLFRMMLGLLEPTAGEIRILGQTVHGAAFRSVRRGVGYLPENVVFYDNLSGAETLAYLARLKGVGEAQCAPLLGRVGLAGAARKRVSEYSKGMRQRLGLAQALLGKPALLFLDEPTTGLDPEAIREFYVLLAELRAEGVTMILSSHILSEIQERVSALAILRNGRIQASGTVQSLREGLSLPVKIHAQLQAGASSSALRTRLYALGVDGITQDAATLAFSCPRALKLAALAALMLEPDLLHDLHVQEPSLEDVYLGHAA